MNILVGTENTQSYQGTTYRSITVTVDNKEVSVMTVINELTNTIRKVNVTYKNAMQKAYRGLGKDFETFEDASANYKDLKIVAAIGAAKQLLN